MRKILLVGGDSFSDQHCYSYKGTDVVTWPILLAEKLDMDLVCLAQSGAGNEQIYSSMLDWLTTHGADNIGLVIAAWSKSERMDWEREGINETGRTPHWANTRVSPKGNSFHFIRKSVRNFYNFQMLCENFNVPYKHFQMISFICDYIWEHCPKDQFEKYRKICIKTLWESPQYDHINGDAFVGWPIFDEEGGFVVADKQVHVGWKAEHKLTNAIEKTRFYNGAKDRDITNVVSSMDPHPNQNGHNNIAEFVYENL